MSQKNLMMTLSTINLASNYRGTNDYVSFAAKLKKANIIFQEVIPKLPTISQEWVKIANNSKEQKEELEGTYGTLGFISCFILTRPNVSQNDIDVAIQLLELCISICPPNELDWGIIHSNLATAYRQKDFDLVEKARLIFKHYQIALDAIPKDEINIRSTIEKNIADTQMLLDEIN